MKWMCMRPHLIGQLCPTIFCAFLLCLLLIMLSLSRACSGEDGQNPWLSDYQLHPGCGTSTRLHCQCGFGTLDHADGAGGIRLPAASSAVQQETAVRPRWRWGGWPSIGSGHRPGKTTALNWVTLGLWWGNGAGKSVTLNSLDQLWISVWQVTAWIFYLFN